MSQVASLGVSRDYSDESAATNFEAKKGQKKEVLVEKSWDLVCPGILGDFIEPGVSGLGLVAQLGGPRGGESGATPLCDRAGLVQPQGRLLVVVVAVSRAA
jgi:hypothetical protein